VADKQSWPALEAMLRKTLSPVLEQWQVDELAQAIAYSATLIRSHEDRHRAAAEIHGQAARDPLAVPWEQAADPADLGEEERKSVRDRFAGGDACPHCGGLHLRACPRVRRLTFHGQEISEVEFWAHGDWPTGDVLWPEDFPPEE